MGMVWGIVAFVVTFFLVSRILRALVRRRIISRRTGSTILFVGLFLSMAQYFVPLAGGSQRQSQAVFVIIAGITMYLNAIELSYAFLPKSWDDEE